MNWSNVLYMVLAKLTRQDEGGPIMDSASHDIFQACVSFNNFDIIKFIFLT